MIILNGEDAIHNLLAFLNNESLTHGTWLASLIIATLAFMGLSLTSLNPKWALGGAFLILWLLGFLMSYVIGRLLYFSTLVTILTRHLSSDWFSTISSTLEKVSEIHKKWADQGAYLAKFTYSFRMSFQLSSMVISAIMGLGIATILFFLGLLYLGRIDVSIILSSFVTIFFSL
jgi:hypothetical protein